MNKIILTERDIQRIVNKVILEMDEYNGMSEHLRINEGYEDEGYEDDTYL